MRVQFKSSEVLILLAAAAMSFLANLPDSILGGVVDKRVLLSALTALVVVAMFRYLQILLLLTISILAIGANLPEGLASALGISQTALLVSLGILVALTLLNRVAKLLPTDQEALASEIAGMRQTLMTAIAKGDQATLQRLLEKNESVNFTLNGTTPLHLAAEKGYPNIVRLLVGHGADFRMKDAAGKTPLEVAQSKMKFIQTEEILYSASRPDFATGQAENRRIDAEIWRGV